MYDTEIEDKDEGSELESNDTEGGGECARERG